MTIACTGRLAITNSGCNAHVFHYVTDSKTGPPPPRPRHTEKGTKEIAPHTDAEWDAVRNAAATLMEAGNLLMIEGRAKDNKEWMAAARRLSDTGNAALKAAQAKNTETLFAEGGNIYKACSACHQKYAPHLQGAAPEAAKK